MRFPILRRVLDPAAWIVGGLLFASPVAALTVTLNPGGSGSTLAVAAEDASLVVDNGAPGSLPFADTLTAVNGGSSSSARFDLSNAGFDITFDHERATAGGALAGLFASLPFQVDVVTNYTIAAQYRVTDPEGQRVYLDVSLLASSGPAPVLLQSYQESRSTRDESFVVGGSGGDFQNTFIGALTGTLVPGQTYIFRVDTRIEVFPSSTTASNRATASGRATLFFVAVPEPGTAVLLGGGLAALAARRGARRALRRGA